MAPLTIFLARLIGLFTLLTSLSMVWRKPTAFAAIAMIIADRPLLFVLGMIALSAGLAMVLSHNIWSGGLLPVAVTLIGWILLFRGLLILVAPAEAITWIFEFVRFEQLFYLYLGGSLVVGCYLTYAGFKASPAQPTLR